MSSILRYTKLAYETFREVNGVLKVNTSSQVGKMGLSDRSYAFLKSYIDFVMNSGVISEVTKIYLKSIESLYKNDHNTPLTFHPQSAYK